MHASNDAIMKHLYTIYHISRIFGKHYIWQVKAIDERLSLAITIFN